MADLGAIAYSYRFNGDVLKYADYNYFGGFYSVSGTIAENSIVSVSRVIAIDSSGRVAGNTFSNSLGEFTINGLTDTPHTIVGIDDDGVWSSDATSITPKEISWSALTQSGLDDNANGNVTTTTNVAELTSGVAAFNNVSTVFGHLQGKWYTEIVATNVVGNMGVGVGNSDLFADALGEDAGSESIGWYADGTVRVGASTIETIFGYVTGDTLRIFYNSSTAGIAFGRVRGSEELYSTNIINPYNTNYTHTFPTGRKKFVACNLVSIGDEVQFNTLGLNQSYRSYKFMPWDARDN